MPLCLWGIHTQGMCCQLTINRLAVLLAPAMSLVLITPLNTLLPMPCQQHQAARNIPRISQMVGPYACHLLLKPCCEQPS